MKKEEPTFVKGEGKMERKTKKVKKEGDTCRDCWIKRFREDIHRQWETEERGQGIQLSRFLNREFQAREDTVKKMREEFADLYDEMNAIKDLAADVYMERYEEEAEEDQSS